jgi:hypothetical protein
MCDPTPAWDGQTTYSVSFPPSCIDDAGSFSLHVFAFAGPHTDNGPNEGTVGPISVMEPAPAPPRNTGYPHACNGAPDFFADAGPAADCLHAWKIAFGKADGTFGEIDSLLRSQVSSLLARLLTTNGVSLTATRSFPDVNPDTVPNAQVRDEIEHLAGAGIIAGFPNGTFGPAGSLSNAQAATFLMRTLQFLHSQQPSIPSFTAAATTIRNYVHVLRVFILDVGATAQDGGDYAVGSTDQTQRGLLADMICQALERMGKALQ